MRGTAKALKSFVGGFGIPAYPTMAVPDDVTLPYLTYPLSEPEWNQKATFYIQGWYRTTDMTELMEKADQIVEAIGEKYQTEMEGGYLVIYPETPTVQIISEGDLRSFYINLSINSYHTPGYYPEEGE